MDAGVMDEFDAQQVRQAALEAKVRNIIDHALHQGQGESKPSVDAVMGWFEAEGKK